jgi:hypothetical protein
MAKEHSLAALEVIERKYPALQEEVDKARAAVTPGLMAKATAALCKQALLAEGSLSAREQRAIVSALIVESGRPEKYPIPLRIRISQETQEDLEKEAARRGTSVSIEARRRLEQSK